jgi:hypothetical protein
VGRKSLSTDQSRETARLTELWTTPSRARHDCRSMDRLPSQAGTTEEVGFGPELAHYNPYLPPGQRLGAFEHRSLQRPKIEVGGRRHPSAKDNHLRVKKANKVSDRKTEKFAKSVEYFHRQPVVLARRRRNVASCYLRRVQA